MRARRFFRYSCFASGVFFFLTPFSALLGLIEAVFPSGEWVTLNGFALLFGGSQQIANGGSLYSFSFSMNPFYIALISFSFIAGLASFFGLDYRRNLIFSLIAGFFTILLSATGVLTFHYFNPGFPLEGIRGGVGFVLSVCFSSLGFLLAIPSIVCAKKRK